MPLSPFRSYPASALLLPCILCPVPCLGRGPKPRIRPVIKHVDPRLGTPGTSVAFKGSHLDQILAVSFGGVPTAAFLNRTSNQFVVRVPAGAKSGSLTCSTRKGDTGAGLFTVATDAPWSYSVNKIYITNFKPVPVFPRETEGHR